MYSEFETSVISSLQNTSSGSSVVSLHATNLERSFSREVHSLLVEHGLDMSVCH